MHRPWLVTVIAIIVVATACGTGGSVDANNGTVEPIPSKSADEVEGDESTSSQAADNESETLRSSTADSDTTDVADTDTDTDTGDGRAVEDDGDEQSDPGGTSPTALDQWHEQLSATCAVALDHMLGVNPFDEGAWGDAAIKSLQAKADGIRALPKPTGFESEVDELLSHLDQVLAVHAESGTSAVAELLDSDSDVSNRIDKLAAELGIENCGLPVSDPAICGRAPVDVIESILGQVPTAEHRDQLGAQGCIWEVGDNRVAFQTGPVKVYAQVADYFRQDGEKVSGIGDEAYLVDGFSSVTSGTTRGSTLWVISGNDLYAVGAIVDDSPVDSAELIAIATAVMANP